MIEFRPIAKDELPAYRTQVSITFLGRSPTPEEMARWPDIDLGRTLAGGIAGVSVLPTYRRRGIITELTTRQLGEMRTRGVSTASLRLGRWKIRSVWARSAR